MRKNNGRNKNKILPKHRIKNSNEFSSIEKKNNRFRDYVSLAIDSADKVSKNTIDTYKDNMTIIQNALTNQIAVNKQKAEAKAEVYKDAWDRFKELGYVDNETTKLINLPVGTRTAEAENTILERYDTYNKLAIQYKNNLAEKDYQYSLDMKKVDADKKEKDIEEQKKANAAKIYASLGNMSATNALDEVSKNFGTLSEYMGSELWLLVEKLNAQKAIDVKAASEREQNRIQNSLDAARIDTTRQQNAISNAMEQQRINIAKQTADMTKNEKENIQALSSVYNNFLQSGKSFDEWFKSPSRDTKMFELPKDVPTIGELLPEKVLTGLVSLLKTKGYFNANDSEDIFNPDGTINTKGLNDMIKGK